MNAIRAFVGHSFTDDDKDVVRAFTEYFDSLEKSNNGFSWVCAKAAEPKLLTEKVMSLIQDRNLFIGICTRKELALDPINLAKIPLLNKHVVNVASIQWKTSDWIIQEIGLAIGRGLEILLLIEEGVRKPGGLQGDVEYIPFHRVAPEKSFVRIMEMITALVPKTSPALTASSTSTSPTLDKDIEISPTDGSWLTPSASWTVDHYGLALFHFIMEGDEPNVRMISETFLASGIAKQDGTTEAWMARNHCYRLVYGKGGDLKTLQSLCEKSPANIEVCAFYGRALDKFEKYLDAAKVYETAASQASNPSEKARMLGLAAIEYAHESRIDRVSAIVVLLRQAVQNKEMGEQEFFNVLETLAEISEDKDFSIAVAERLVDLSPDSFRARFSLAYIHSEAGNEDLALHHYLKIPVRERRAMDWNNLGASFDHFKLQEKAVRAFRKSEEMGETLAMGNLGNKMLNAGLFSEAQAICDKALATKEFHKSVGHLSIRLREVPEQETKDLTEVLEQAKPKIEFYRSLGRALGLAEPKNVAGTWIGPECELEAMVTNEQITLVGNYEREANPLAFGLGMVTRQPVKHRVEYTGILRGCAIQGKITRSSDESATTKSLLGELFAGATKVLMFVSDDKTEISVLENPAAISPKVFIMRRSPATLLLAARMRYRDA